METEKRREKKKKENMKKKRVATDAKAVYRDAEATLTILTLVHKLRWDADKLL